MLAAQQRTQHPPLDGREPLARPHAGDVGLTTVTRDDERLVAPALDAEQRRSERRFPDGDAGARQAVERRAHWRRNRNPRTRRVTVERERRGLDAPAEHVAFPMEGREHGARLLGGAASRDDERRIYRGIEGGR
ncbi:MAG TPA: hypothetical protein VGO62_04175 [Myxococcota bacterium]